MADHTPPGNTNAPRQQTAQRRPVRRPVRLHTWRVWTCVSAASHRLKGSGPLPPPPASIPPSPQGRDAAGFTPRSPTCARWLDPLCPPHPQGGPWPTHCPLSRSLSEWPLSPACGKSFSGFSAIFLQVYSSPRLYFVFLRGLHPSPWTMKFVFREELSLLEEG